MGFDCPCVARLGGPFRRAPHTAARLAPPEPGHGASPKAASTSTGRADVALHTKGARVSRDAGADAACSTDGRGGENALPIGRFYLATLVIQRTRQLEKGARPRVAANGHRPPRLALREVLAGAIAWSVTPAGQ